MAQNNSFIFTGKLNRWKNEVLVVKGIKHAFCFKRYLRTPNGPKRGFGTILKLRMH